MIIPSPAEEIWKNLLIKDEHPPLKSLSLKLKLASLKTNIKIEKISLAAATFELHRYCVANRNLCKKDLELIFKNS